VYDIIEQMGDPDEHISHYAVDMDLSWLGDGWPGEGFRVMRTLLVSADRDLLAEEIPHLKEQFGAVAGDWESGAIAWVAARNDTRCLILRGVTDLVGSHGGEAYGDMGLYVENTTQVLGSLVGWLPSWIARARSIP
jgi:adenosylhomocysteine nucleosidase